jgi:hypothetical protein
MTSTADEAELYACCRVEGRENLFVAFGVDYYIGETRDASSIECIARKASVQYLDCDVLHARAVFGKSLVHFGVMVRAHEHHSDSACFGGDDR